MSLLFEESRWLHIICLTEAKKPKNFALRLKYNTLSEILSKFNCHDVFPD